MKKIKKNKKKNTKKNRRRNHSGNQHKNENSDLNNEAFLDELHWEELQPARRSLIRSFFNFIFLLLVIISIPAAYVISKELKTSELQAFYFHEFAKDCTFSVKEGKGTPYPAPSGPYNKKHGYTDISRFQTILENKGFKQTTYTEVSENGKKLLEYDLSFPYKAKASTGLHIFDGWDRPLYSFNEPRWVFPDFESISSPIVDTLLFIEDRALLNPTLPHKNPAVEWDRFFKAIMELILDKVVSSRKVPGGSTLATQIEKYRHSDGGRTSSPADKIKQMISASLKAYQDDIDTLKVRKEIVVDYINSVPLAAIPGHGEIHGLGDGLFAYYGEDPKYVNDILAKPSEDLSDEELTKKAIAFKQVLSLFLAHRRPSDYLDHDQENLMNLIDKYLPILFKAGIIDYSLYKKAISQSISYNRVIPSRETSPFTEKKAPMVVRNHLLSNLNLTSLYELDRLDLKVNSTINKEVQKNTSKFLLSLHDNDNISKLGLDEYRLLHTNADPEKVIYSLTLFEQENGINKLRIQTDTYNQPFNINEGVKLDLGSTAKFRTLVTYLEVIEEIYLRYKDNSKESLRETYRKSLDPLSNWVLLKLINKPDMELEEILDLSMNRKYSANPGERFFTGGGLHTFENFNKKDNNRIVTIAHALRHSINLPFIRLMRDISKYFSYHTSGSTARTLKDMPKEERVEYLEKFADKEGKIFISRFYKKYRGKSPDEILSILLESVRKIPKRFASIYWFIFPEHDLDNFISFMQKNVDKETLSVNELKKYYDWYSIRAKSLGDKGYLAKMHPLELWVAGFLYTHPGANLQMLFDESKDERIEVYDWLMRTSIKSAQDKRIRIILEAEAFTEIHHRWEKLGYPLASLVPSYATALGTSADRPDALAELMGIILNNGYKYPKSSINSITFAENTPYETSFKFQPESNNKVLSDEVSKIARNALFDVVSNGTGVRLRDGLKHNDEKLKIGGKTGTGDHRYVVYKPSGVKDKKVVNRTATFMFIIGDRFFGVVSVFVPGEQAANYKFTSALPVQILKLLLPDIENLVSSRS